MYDIAFCVPGFRLPFTNFKVADFQHLQVAPSQLHPNGTVFVRAFQIVCEYLRIGATIPLFFYFFHIQRSRIYRRW